MTLPIVAYGDPILRKIAKEIGPGYPDLHELIDQMYETMYAAPGVGLAAPQIGKDIRLFVVDSAYALAKKDEHNEQGYSQEKNEPDDEFAQETGIKKVFINAKMIKQFGKKWTYEEGCLSIPGIREQVERPDTIIIEYLDEHFIKHTEQYTGFTARVIQHEYDHIEGILFIDRLSPLKKRMLKNKLHNISKGLIEVSYKMKFPQRHLVK